MTCCHNYFATTEGGEEAFSVDVSTITYGAGCLAEAGGQARALGIGRVALFTDKRLAATEHVARVKESLGAAGVDFVLYDEVRVEPTDVSFQASRSRRILSGGPTRARASTMRVGTAAVAPARSPSAHSRAIWAHSSSKPMRASAS